MLSNTISSCIKIKIWDFLPFEEWWEKYVLPHNKSYEYSQQIGEYKLSLKVSDENNNCVKFLVSIMTNNGHTTIFSFMASLNYGPSYKYNLSYWYFRAIDDTNQFWINYIKSNFLVIEQK